MQFSHYWNEEEKSDIFTIKKIQKELKDELGYPLHGKNMIIRCKQIIDGNWPIIIDLAETIHLTSF